MKLRPIYNVTIALFRRFFPKLVQVIFYIVLLFFLDYELNSSKKFVNVNNCVISLLHHTGYEGSKHCRKIHSSLTLFMLF